MQTAEQIIAAQIYLASLYQQEVALANAWAQKASSIVAFAQSTLTPANLRTQAENELATALDGSLAQIAQQIAENAANAINLI